MRANLCVTVNWRFGFSLPRLVAQLHAISCQSSPLLQQGGAGHNYLGSAILNLATLSIKVTVLKNVLNLSCKSEKTYISDRNKALSILSNSDTN